MQRTMKAQIAGTLSHTNTARLQKLLSVLESWEVNHNRKKKSYFWKPAVSARDRRSAEKRYTFTDCITIGSLELTYESDCADSCNYIYWTDSLTVNIPRTIITFGDISHLISTIKEILAKRNTAKSA